MSLFEIFFFFSCNVVSKPTLGVFEETHETATLSQPATQQTFRYELLRTEREEKKRGGERERERERERKRERESEREREGFIEWEKREREKGFDRMGEHRERKKNTDAQ